LGRVCWNRSSTRAQEALLTYLKLADKRLGLRINFNVALIKDGIIHIVNGLQE